MSYPVKAAHYHASKAAAFLTLVEVGQSFGEGKVIPVSGKVEARRIAAEHGAKCWNF